MDRCPDKETLEKFLDHELNDEMNENIFSHLQVCDNCKNTIRSLLSDKKSLLGSLFKEPIYHKNKKLSSSGRCLSKAAILSYAQKCLDENQLKLVESHLEKCDNCLHRLIELQKTMTLPSEIELDVTALAGTERRVVRTGIDILEMVFKIKENVLELIRHTGELLTLRPQFGAVRGEELKTDSSIVIRKDFKDLDLSVEIIVNKELIESEVVLIVSIMKLSKEEFIQGVDVSLSGDGTYQHRKTDEDGIIKFHGVKEGKYDINIGRQRIVLITFG